MLLYCIITWLLGAGIAHELHQQDKKEGKELKNLFKISCFVFLSPIVIPFAIGMVLVEKD